MSIYKYKLNTNCIKFKDFLLDIKKHFATDGKTIHKARNEVKTMSFGGSNLVVKSFKKPNFINQILYLLYKSPKASKSYQNALQIGDITPKPVGYILFYDNFFINNSYYLSYEFSYDFVIREALINRDFPNKDEVLRQFAKFSFELHQRGILHLDYSAGNILVRQNGDSYEFKIVDINRMKFKTLNLDERLKSFAMLWASDEDMSKIASFYAKFCGEDCDICVKKALKYSRNLKFRKNFKKKLKRLLCL